MLEQRCAGKLVGVSTQTFFLSTYNRADLAPKRERRRVHNLKIFFKIFGLQSQCLQIPADGSSRRRKVSNASLVRLCR